MNVEETAIALGFNIEKEASGYVVKDGADKIALAAANLSKVKTFLFRHVKTMAKAVDHRLTSQRNTQSLYELTSGEARAKQAATTSYMLERKQVILDESRREDLVGNTEHNRKMRDDRAKGGGRKIEWVVVLGPDHSATLDEVIEYLTRYQAERGIDADDVEVDDEIKPKVKPPTVQKMHAALKGHTEADKIKEIGVGNQKLDRRPKREEIRSERSILHILGTLDGPGSEKIPPSERQRLCAELRRLQREHDKAKSKKGNYDTATKDDPILRVRVAATQEAVRQRLLFERVDKILLKPAIGAEVAFDVEWEERDPSAPDWRWVSGQRVGVISYRDACRRPAPKLPTGALDGIRLQKAKALIEKGHLAGAGAILIQVKRSTKGRRGAFGRALAAAHIHPRTASRCMVLANSDSN
jgi:hypothetical protein